MTYNDIFTYVTQRPENLESDDGKIFWKGKWIPGQALHEVIPTAETPKTK